MRQLVLMIAIGAAMVFAASAMIGCEADSANGAVNGSADEVVGSWIVDIAPEGGDAFKALLTFTPDADGHTDTGPHGNALSHFHANADAIPDRARKPDIHGDSNPDVDPAVSGCQLRRPGHGGLMWSL